MQTEAYVYKKEVDWSLFNYGFAIPLEHQVIFKQVADRFIDRGESKTIHLYLNGKSYEAKLNNNKISNRFGNRGDIVQVRYTQNSDLAVALRGLFQRSYAYIKGMKQLQEPGSKEEVTVDDLYDSIGKLEIISITLDPDDDPQLIFESLNSTGLALTEGDKIRNYILMGMSPKDQELYYDNYWTKIEQCTANDVSGFIRDYLSVKCLSTPTISNVYQAFKRYAEETALPIETLLSDILRYARFYDKLLTCKSGLGNTKLNDCLYRLKRLEIAVTRPFFMEVLRLNQDKKLSVDEVLQVFEITENYLFRRNICEVPTNALNKIFLNLNKEICRYDNTPNGYIDKLVYALLSKKESGRFPNDDEFTEALENKSVYQMRGKYKAYLFIRFQ